LEAKPNADWGQIVSERYSSDALVYRDLWAPLLLPHGQELLDSLQLSSADRIVDVGSGCGALLPGIRSRAPEALVIAIDRAPGMLAIAPVEVPRAVMDAGRLGLASASIDAAVLAFVLFHTADPQEVLIEGRRVLRSGGMIGTTTWDGDPRFPAQRVWLEELDSHGAAKAALEMMSNHEPVGTPERMRGLLQEAGFGSIRTWSHSFGHAYTLEEFMTVRTTLGWSKRRVDSLDPERREAFLRDARVRLENLGPHDFIDDAEVIFATGVAR
jgi:ubiquinone/menaquinone biosynthesis C-methylase UbiE